MRCAILRRRCWNEEDWRRHDRKCSTACGRPPVFFFPHLNRNVSIIILITNEFFYLVVLVRQSTFSQNNRGRCRRHHRDRQPPIHIPLRCRSSGGKPEQLTFLCSFGRRRPLGISGIIHTFGRAAKLFDRSGRDNLRERDQSIKDQKRRQDIPLCDTVGSVSLNDLIVPVSKSVWIDSGRKVSCSRTFSRKAL